MKTFFTVKTTAYAGPELGPKDTVTVHIQRYDAAGLLTSREVLPAIVIDTDTIATAEEIAAIPDLGHEIDEDDRNRNDDGSAGLTKLSSDEALREFAKMASDEAHRALQATPDQTRAEANLPPGCSQPPKLFKPNEDDEDDEDPRPYHDIERGNDEATDDDDDDDDDDV